MKVNKKKEVKSKKVKSSDAYKLEDNHPDHDKHLCHIVGLRNMKTVANLSKDAQYICIACGRAAKNMKNLCGPVKI